MKKTAKSRPLKVFSVPRLAQPLATYPPWRNGSPKKVGNLRWPGRPTFLFHFAGQIIGAWLLTTVPEREDSDHSILIVDVVKKQAAIHH